MLPTNGPLSMSMVRTEMSQSLITNYSMSCWSVGNWGGGSAPIYAPVNVYSTRGTFYSGSGTNISMSYWYNYNHTTASATNTTASLFMTTNGFCYPSSMVVFDAGTTNTTFSFYISGSNDGAGINSLTIYYGKPWQSDGTRTGSATIISGSGTNENTPDTITYDKVISGSFRYTYDVNKGQYLYIVCYYDNCYFP